MSPSIRASGHETSLRTRARASGHERSPPDTAFPSPVRARPSPFSRACRDEGEQRRAIRPFRAPHMPMAHCLRAAQADPRVHLPMRRRRSWSCSSTPASPAGGAGTAWPRPSEREPEVIFVVLSVRSRRAVGTHVSPAMWQPIFFINDGGGPASLPACSGVRARMLTAGGPARCSSLASACPLRLPCAITHA